MSEADVERLVQELRADADLESAARQLQDRLITLAREADHLFPYFPNSPFRLIEVEPDVNSGPNRGFVAICPDGLLYELSVGLDFDQYAPGRQQGLRELDLSPQEFIPYAYNAICQITEMLGRSGNVNE